MAAIGRWKDAERDIVKSVPEPPRQPQQQQLQLQKAHPGGGRGGGGGGPRGMLAHMRRFSADGRRARSQSGGWGKGRSIDLGRGR